MPTMRGFTRLRGHIRAREHTVVRLARNPRSNVSRAQLANAGTSRIDAESSGRKWEAGRLDASACLQRSERTGFPSELRIGWTRSGCHRACLEIDVLLGADYCCAPHERIERCPRRQQGGPISIWIGRPGGS
jgi:hypothetical protein